MLRFHAIILVSTMAWASIGSASDAANGGKDMSPADPASERSEAARNAYDAWAAEFFVGREAALGVYLWSRRLMEADEWVTRRAPNPRPAEAHLNRMKAVEKFIIPTVAARRRGVESFLAVEYYLADAQAHFFHVKAGHGAQARMEAKTKRLAAAVLIWEESWPRFEQRGKELKFFSGLFWSNRLWLAENAVRTEKVDRIATADENLHRAQGLEKIAQSLVKEQLLPHHYLHAATFYRLEAEKRLSDLKEGSRDAAPAERERGRRAQLIQAAKAAYETWWQAEPRSRDFEDLYWYSLSWRKADLWAASTRSQRIAANECHLARMKELEKSLEKVQATGRLSDRYLFSARYYRADAEILLSQARTE